MKKNNMEIRELVPDDWEIFRNIRLFALKTEPGKFSSNYTLESGFSEQEWRGRLSGPVRAYFGLFDNDRIVGITGVVRVNQDMESSDVVLVASFLKPEYRRQGLSRMFYQARLDWAAKQPGVKNVLVSHRESNIASQRANQAFGFVMTGKEMMEWPDGMKENQVLYTLDISGYKNSRKNTP